MTIEKITLLIGCPGAGKSTLGNKIFMQNPTTSIFFDDMGILVKNSNYDNPIDYIHNNILDTTKHIIISDVYFCITSVKETAVNLFKKEFSCPIDFFYFENNLNKCLDNIKYRQSMGDLRQVSELTKDLSKKYLIPDNIVPLPIYQTNLNKNQKIKI